MDAFKPVTISSIAESAGVSIPTVSKVLNGKPGVAPHTRARVEAVINEFGYRRPEPPKRAGETLELVFDDLEHLWAIEIIRGVRRAAGEHDAGMLLSELGPHEPAARRWIDDVLVRRPSCVVSVARLSAAHRGRLKARGIPFVLFDPDVELPDGVPFVGATNWSGGRSATRHLIELGHRRIAMIAGPDHAPSWQARLDGFRSAMEAAGLPVGTGFAVRTDLSPEGGEVAARELLRRPERPTAIFACSDVQAVGVYRAARHAGLSIPRDLSIVGFDDLPVAMCADPPLTTVRQPLVEMAMTATELALALGRGENPRQTGLELATNLIVRESTAPPVP